MSMAGCTRSTCVCTCQAETFTYTVFIGEVCAESVDQAEDYAVASNPCQPGDPLILTECSSSDNLCFSPGVQVPLKPVADNTRR